MNDLISRALSAFCAGLLALAYPGVSVEALTASQEASERGRPSPGLSSASQGFWVPPVRYPEEVYPGT